MAHDLQQLFDLLARNSGKPDAWILRKANAALEWQAGSYGGEAESWSWPVHSKGLLGSSQAFKVISTLISKSLNFCKILVCHQVLVVID